MRTLLTIILGALLVVGIVALVSVLGGLFVWLLWPAVVPVAFPGLVASGAIAGELSFWHSILLAWLCGTLFKSAGNGYNSSKK